MSERKRRLTFALLDKEKGFTLPPAEAEEYPLPAWYRSVYYVPLVELGVEDVCKALRQDIHIEHVVPIALQYLESESLAGERYDGEMLVALNSIPIEFWQSHRKEAMDLRLKAEKARKLEIPSDLHDDVKDLLRKLPSY